MVTILPCYCNQGSDTPVEPHYLQTKPLYLLIHSQVMMSYRLFRSLQQEVFTEIYFEPRKSILSNCRQNNSSSQLQNMETNKDCNCLYLLQQHRSSTDSGEKSVLYRTPYIKRHDTSKQAIRESNSHFAKANQKNLQIEETRLLYA